MAISPASPGRITSSSARATGGWRRSMPWRGAWIAGGRSSAPQRVHWREVRTRRDHARYYASPGNPRTHQRRIREIDWDDFAVVPRLAHERGMRAELYVSVLDEGRPLPSRRERERSFHNAMHGQHVTWQSTFSRAHPEFAVVDRAGETRQWGVLCFGYPEVRQHFRDRIQEYLRGYDWDGVFLCLRTQARPATFADQFGFNAPVREAMRERHGVDILSQDFDLDAWRAVNGEFFTTFLRELRQDLRAARSRALGRRAARRHHRTAGRQLADRVADLGRGGAHRRAGDRPELLAMPVDVAPALADAPRLRLSPEPARRPQPAAAGDDAARRLRPGGAADGDRARRRPAVEPALRRGRRIGVAWPIAGSDGLWPSAPSATTIRGRSRRAISAPDQNME